MPAYAKEGRPANFLQGNANDRSERKANVTARVGYWPAGDCRHATREVIRGNSLLDLTGIAIGQAQAQHVLGLMLGSAESAPNRRHRPDAREEQD
jgi:hypothetical protein